MTLNELLILEADNKIGYRDFPGMPIVAATVKRNGPGLDREGNEVSLLVVAVEGSTEIHSWTLTNFPDGIPQLFPASEIGTRPGYRDSSVLS